VTARVALERILRTSVVHPAGEAEPTADPHWNEFKTLPLRLETRLDA
jgi:hypothetical protein